MKEGIEGVKERKNAEMNCREGIDGKEMNRMKENQDHSCFSVIMFTIMSS